MKVALVHDWLVSYRGGEKVLAALAELYPRAPIYTLFYKASALPPELRSRQIICPPSLQWLRPLRKALLPLLPHCIEALPLFDYDLIISTSSCVAKGVIPAPGAKHLSYIHSPMRYIWDQRQEYLQQLPRIPGLSGLIHLLSKNLRLWDVVSTGRCDSLVVNSSFVGKRVEKYYGRKSKVIHPPIDNDFFVPRSAAAAKEREGYWLAAGAFVAYKRFDLAIGACEQLKQPLIVAGSGPEEKKLRRLAGPYTKFRIKPEQGELRSLLQGARGLLFPGLEDFGMIAIEAMACGTPVLALQAGGALDYIKPGVTGDFFAAPRLEALSAALQSFRAESFDSEQLVAFAGGFSKRNFQAQMQAAIEQLCSE